METLNMGVTSEKEFKQANLDWERLIRTEMITIAEKAKIKEWEVPKCRCTLHHYIRKG